MFGDFTYQITVLEGTGCGDTWQAKADSEEEAAEAVSRVFSRKYPLPVARLGRGVYQCRARDNSPVGPRFQVAVVCPPRAEEYIKKMMRELS